MELKRAKVVMLPTQYNNRSIGQLCISNGEIKGNLFISEQNISDSIHKPQHLYIITNDKIEAGDYVLFEYEGLRDILKCTKVKEDLLYHTGGNTGVEFCKKVIATTDKLIIFNKINDKTIYVPQPSKGFIDRYCNRQGIDDILIEYENYMAQGWIPSFNNPDNSGFDDSAEIEIKLKVNSHNEITIHPIKESWTKEEVIELIDKAIKSAVLLGERCSPNTIIYFKEKWIKENL